MTERGLPTSDGAPACPFVAFEDDRDERAASPDHRHRCYAEPNPAPRALAHQEAYCLSSAFPVCPTFQDWARREAARSRAESMGASDADASGLAAERAQRNPPRNWQAPPPWMGGVAGSDAEDEVDDRWERDEDLVPPPPPRADDSGLEDDGNDSAPADDDDADDLPADGRGLSGSYADRMAAGGAMAAAVGADAPGPASEASQSEDLVPVADGDWRASPAASAAPGAQPVRPRRERDPDRMAAFSESQANAAPASASAPQRPRRRDPGAPEWERARTTEAYPTLRARRLPELSVPPILVSVIALALAAAVLFALPGLLGFGNTGGPGAGASPTRGVSSSQPPVESLEPTIKPGPTQRTYVVRANDTMSRIANRFDVTLEDLVAANAETVPNPDKLAVGDVLIIPSADSGGEPAGT